MQEDQGQTGSADVAIIEKLAARVQDLEEKLAAVQTSVRPRRSTRAKALLAIGALGAVLGIGSWAGRALSQSTCTQTLPSPLKTFCAGEPAVASQMNGNFQQVINWTQQKVGTFGTADVTITGNETVAGNENLSGNLNLGATTRQMVNLWGTNYGIGVQNGSQYSRSDKNFVWYVGGSHNDGERNAGGGTEVLYFNDRGALESRSGIRDIGGVGRTYYGVSLGRYIVEAPPAVVGQVVAIDQTIMDSLCRDADGCGFTIAMVNWDGTGNVATSQGRMFISETSRSWRVQQAYNGGLPEGAEADNNGALGEVSGWDCYLTDAETSTSTNNGRSDSGTGFGLLNCRGCNYNDSLTTCRVIFED